MENNFFIGFKIIPTLYLTIDTGETKSFNVENILNIKEVDGVTHLEYKDNYNGLDLDVTYTVLESNVIIEEMIEKSKKIKQECIDLIKKYSE
jgi:hypothetical protein